MTGNEIALWFTELFAGGCLVGWGFHAGFYRNDRRGWFLLLAGLIMMAGFVLYGPDLFI